MNKYQTVAVSFSAPVHLIAATRAIAEETEGQNFSSVVRAALAEYVAKYGAQVAA